MLQDNDLSTPRSSPADLPAVQLASRYHRAAALWRSMRVRLQAVGAERVRMRARIERAGHVRFVLRSERSRILEATAVEVGTSCFIAFPVFKIGSL